ncbi:MAG: S8 family serine peptidase [bacterium]|nr:S8 family serine peptidase [bacterium]
MWAGELNVFLNAFYFWMEPILCYFDNPDRTVVHSNYSLDESNASWMLSTAAFASKVSWPSIDGSNYSYTDDVVLNSIADFSSPGPSRDRRVKPDIAGPGQTIVSSLTKDVTYPDPYVAPDGQHMIMNGTSQAAPHVTGAVALMMQKHGYMNITQVRNMLTSYARHDRYTDQFGAQGMGYGKLNVKPLNEVPVAIVTAAMQDDGLILFDGSGSYDAEDFALTYEFEFEAVPVDGTSEVSYNKSTETNKAYVLPDPAVDAYYRVKFRVNDGVVNSSWVYSDWVLVQH